MESEGEPIETDGAVLSTLKVVLGPALEAELLTESVAVPAAREMPMVPSPVIEEMVTVRLLPLPETLTVPVAPLVLSVTFPEESVLEAKCESE